MPTRASRAAVAISERLEADGLSVTPSQVQFWAEKGLLGQATKSWPGGGGSEVAYPDDALEVARLIHFLPRTSRRRSDVVLACFCRGLAVSVHELREALVAEAQALWDEAGEGVASAQGEDEVADAAAEVATEAAARRRRPAVLRTWERNSRGWEPAGSSERPEDDAMGSGERLRFLLSAVLAALGGEPTRWSRQWAGSSPRSVWGPCWTLRRWDQDDGEPTWKRRWRNPQRS